MELKTVLSCPLGSQCETIKDEAIHRCAWFITLDGMHPTTGEIIQDKGCAMAWMPILMIENSKQQKSTAAAVESFRNEMVQSNELNTSILLTTEKLRLTV